MRARIVAGVLAAFICSVAARAQTPAPGWILIVRIVQNPLPIGRCAGISIEIQDEHGYRRNELSNGGIVDFHKFRYDADTTNFQWQDGNPINGYLCTRAASPPSRVTVTVTLPDGLVGSADLSSIAPGQSALPVQYAKQGPLKIPGVPPPLPSGRSLATVATPATSGAAGIAPAAGVRAAGSSGALTPAPTSVAVGGGRGTAAASLTGSSATHAPAFVTTSALTMTGSFTSMHPIAVTTAALTFTGTSAYFAARTPMVVATSALSMMGGFAPVNGQIVTTATLSMTGGFPAFAPQTVNTQKLTMTGTAP